MKLTFFGAAKAVTGSCHCVEVAGKKILVDCGLQQGRDERDNAVLEDGAKKLGMSPSTLSRRCKDPGSMTVDELLNFGRKYHVPIDELRQALRY